MKTLVKFLNYIFSISAENSETNPTTNEFSEKNEKLAGKPCDWYRCNERTFLGF